MSLRTFAAGLLGLLFFVPAVALADAASDLADGRKALTEGDLESAEKLLSSAAQALPDSVEANLALAECRLQLGQIEQALASFQTVVRLSPDHGRARKMVAALTGTGSSAEKQLEAARALMAVGAWDQSTRLLTSAVIRPQDDTSRNTARLLLAESHLWFQKTPQALGEAMRLIQESDDDVQQGQGRVIAALALLHSQEDRSVQAEQLLLKLGELDEGWRGRARVAAALIQLRRSGDPVAVSNELAESTPHVPEIGLKSAIITGAKVRLVQTAQGMLAKGNDAGALAIVWPMVSRGEIPADDVFLKPVAASGGWLIDSRTPGQTRVEIARLLLEAGRIRESREGRNRGLPATWLALEVLRQSRQGDKAADAELIRLAGQFGNAVADRGRRKGDVLSQGDELQRALLLQLAGRVTTVDERKKIIVLVLSHIDRYKRAGDLATGLSRFVTVNDEPLEAFPTGPLGQMARDEALRTLISQLGVRYAELGATELSKQQNSVVTQPDDDVNRFDQIALRLFSRSIQIFDQDDTATKGANGITERYAAASLWAQAQQTLDVYHAGLDPVTARWAGLQLAIRQATTREDRLLRSRRTIGQELSEQIRTALAEVVSLVRDDPAEASRNRAIAAAGSLVSRYAGLNRTDLSEAVIARVADGDDGAASLGDWATWLRAGLVGVDAKNALAQAVNRAEDRNDITVNESHEAELKLLSDLITNFPTSNYAAQAVGRVREIATEYQSYRAFDASRTVLTGFLTAQPKLRATEQIEYQIVQLALSKAHASFQERSNRTTAPTELSADHVAAIDALAAWLDKYPDADQSAAAEDALFQVARLYAEADGWSVARDVLARFSAAVPDFRSPAHLKLLEAATWLGELDQKQGLALLTPNPPKPVSSQTAMPGTTVFMEDSDKALGKSGGGIAGGAGSKVARVPAPGQPRADEKKPFDDAAEAAREADIAKFAARSQPTASSLAAIRQAQQRQFQQLAMLESSGPAAGDGKDRGKEGERASRSSGVTLPGGVLLSEAEMSRQNDAADKAYAILIELIKDKSPRNTVIGRQARTQMMWLFSFFEGQVRPDQAIVLINRYLKDNAAEPERAGLAYRALTDRLVQVSRRQPTELIDQQWVDERHALFEQARREIAAFVEAWKEKPAWAQPARLLVVDSYQQESQLVSIYSRERAGGLLVQASEALIELSRTAADHPEAAGFPDRLWAIADQLVKQAQNESAISVVRNIGIYFPTHALAGQSTLRIAQLYAANLSNPVRAVETYQEYLSHTEGDASVPTAIFEIARQLGTARRYLEALHVYGVFVDSFPTDSRAAVALHAIGQTHQANGAWPDAITSYERLFEQYPAAEIIQQARLDVAECRINLGEWREARRLYEEFIKTYPKHAQVKIATARLDVLKRLGRFQDLLADDMVDRNKDDAQFQIGKTVLNELSNPIKAVSEFRTVVAEYPKSDVADDAQLEIGKALLGMNRLDEGREELLKVPELYPSSPLADDALFLIAGSYETQAQNLAGVTIEKAREESFLMEQRDAYVRFNRRQMKEAQVANETRGRLKKSGKNEELELNDAFEAFRQESAVAGQLFCEVTQAELLTETETALQIANRRDRINDAFREAVVIYTRAVADYPLGDRTDQSLLRIADILETKLKDRPAAMQTYQRIVKLFPGTPVAEDAAWKVARFHVEEARYAAAVDAYQTFIRNYPSSARVADAQFGMAEVLEQLGKWNEAMDAYEIFRQKFNKHPKVQLASQQITWIKTYRK